MGRKGAAAHGAKREVPGVSSWEWEQGDFTLSYRRMGAIALDRARRGDSESPILIIFRAVLIDLIELECCDVRSRRWGNWWRPSLRVRILVEPTSRVPQAAERLLVTVSGRASPIWTDTSDSL